MELKSKWQRKYKLDVLIAIIIALLPFLGYIHLLFSEEIKTFSLFGFEYSHIFSSNRSFVWSLLKNILPFTLLVIWFLTISLKCKYLIIPLFILYLNNLLNNLFAPFGKYIFYPFHYESYPLTINILIIILIIGFIILLDTHYFKHYRKRFLEVSIKSIIDQNINISSNIYRDNLKSLIENRNEITTTNYFRKIYSAKLILGNWLKNTTGTITNDVNKNSYYLNIFVSTSLVIATLLWFIHYLIPGNIQKWDLGIIQVYNNGFTDVQIFLWFLIRKLIIIIPMILWFLTCQHWWKYAILSPIILYSYQFWEATQDVRYLDAAGNIKAFPAIFCIILILLMISKTIKYRVEILIMYEHLIGEIDDLLKNGEFNSNNRPFLNIKRFTNLKEEIAKETNAQQQLTRLMSLREELIKQLHINF